MRTRGMHDLILGEKFLATHGRGLSVVTGECPGHHAHPKEEGTGFPCGFLKSALVRFFYFPRLSSTYLLRHVDLCLREALF
jgi:hypothetical protein